MELWKRARHERFKIYYLHWAQSYVPMSDDTSRQFASRRTGVLGGSRLFHELADDRNRARPAPSLARLAWLERPDPDSARGDLARLVAAPSPAPVGQAVEPEGRGVISDRASIDAM
jgi:hypothetical protein